MSETVVINEIYLSLQGESSWAGWPCVFLRLTACNLRCSYCDTAYAFTAGDRRSLADIRAEVQRLAAPFARSSPSVPAPPALPPIPSPQSAIRNPPFRLPLVELTGGEPLLQPKVLPFMRALCDDGYTVLLETSGALDIAPVDPRVHRIMDLKAPSSGEAERNRWENLRHLTPADELKFVLGTREDYEWMKHQILAHQLAEICPLLVSWVSPLTREQQDPSLKSVPAAHSSLTRRQLAEAILADALPVRFQVQMHKVIWPAEQRGV